MPRKLHHRLAELEQSVRTRTKQGPVNPFVYAKAEAAWLAGRGPRPRLPELVPPHTPESWASALRLALGLELQYATPDMTPAEANWLNGVLLALQCTGERMAFEQQMDLR